MVSFLHLQHSHEAPPMLQFQILVNGLLFNTISEKENIITEHSDNGDDSAINIFLINRVTLLNYHCLDFVAL